MRLLEKPDVHVSNYIRRETDRRVREQARGLATVATTLIGLLYVSPLGLPQIGFWDLN